MELLIQAITITGIIIAFVLVSVLVLIAIAAIKTLGVKSDVLIAEKLPVDKKRAENYAKDLSDLIKAETISSRYDPSRDKFYAFHKLIEEKFPLIHKNCEKVDFNGSLLFKWSGRNEAEPILFMSHMDVVEAPGVWKYPAFSGEIAEGAVWGRGTVDTKGSLFCFFSAVEELIEAGYTPKGDVYLASSCTEEWSGEGAPKTVEYLEEKGVRLGLVLDEGGMIVEEPISGVKGRYAMLGVLEKGYGDVKFIAKSTGGHASAPCKNTPIPRLAKFIVDVEKNNPFKVEFNSTVTEMFTRMAPNMGFGMKMVFSNMWLFKPLLKSLMPKISPTGAAMLQTTCAFTTQKGSEGLNVLPQEAYVTANMRYIPHQGTEESIHIISELAKKYNLETEVIYKSYPCPVVDYKNPVFKNVENTIKTIFPGVVPTPYIMTGGTDARFYTKICSNCIRFAPLEINQQQLSSVHALDENIFIDAIPPAVDFYKTIIETWQ